MSIQASFTEKLAGFHDAHYGFFAML